VQGVTIQVKEAKPRIGSVYMRARADSPVNQSVRSQFLIRKQDCVSGNSKRRGKSSSWRQSNTALQLPTKDDLAERLIQLPLQGHWRSWVQANLGDDGFDRYFQNGSFQSYPDIEY
jgi:hypothetical protein